MRLHLIAAFAAAAAVAGCTMSPMTTVTPAPGRAPIVVTPPTPGAAVVVTPKATVQVPDTATARTVVNAEMARRLPGRNVGPVTDCVISNASQAELADISAQQGKPAAAGAVAAIVKRPATSQCIARANLA
ncbi:hypothetical protein [Paracoccus contaminans]|uniref:Succinate dehydrogenase n=1 Tax=Paracoccus contaminans TaxID=1945662 RepID=A0A1W6CYB3_9RHOB|nr:hypothetical protein [Paracoccus contaminans]ARJ69836.1 hypothetical protein B0A89_09580 [Paracoccus contaminans]